MRFMTTCSPTEARRRSSSYATGTSKLAMIAAPIPQPMVRSAAVKRANRPARAAGASVCAETGDDRPDRRAWRPRPTPSQPGTSPSAAHPLPSGSTPGRPRRPWHELAPLAANARAECVRSGSTTAHFPRRPTRPSVSGERVSIPNARRMVGRSPPPSISCMTDEGTRTGTQRGSCSNRCLRSSMLVLRQGVRRR
jgi:hypothetical protein